MVYDICYMRGAVMVDKLDEKKSNMNYKQFVFIIQESLSTSQKKKLWKRIISYTFRIYDRLAEKTRNKKELRKDLYDKASEEYQKELTKRK